TVASDIDEDACIAAAKADPAVMKWIEGKEVARAIYIPGRMVTLVVE
ncbi:hypothetical protein IIA79_08450, partial [bacterium]|nr:hypothetical protein [bacterium]